MKIIKKRLIIAIFLFSSSLAFAQQPDISEGDTLYQEYAYINASEIYKELVDSGFESQQLLKKLANSFYFISLYPEAAEYYERLFKLDPKQEAIIYMRYAKSLKATGQVQNSNKDFKANWETLAGKEAIRSSEIDFEQLLEANSGRYSIEELKFNSPNTDYGATTDSQGQLIFASTRDTGIIRRSLSSDLYTAVDPQSSASTRKISGEINTRMHESSAIITRDGNTMYFTRSRRVASKDGKEDISTLGIYRAQLIDGKWDKVENLSINSNNFSNAHPALSPGEDFLWFSSDRPGGYGESDIYRVELFADNSMGEPLNLGGTVNTIGRETFPFVSSENHLYFSSDGHFGLGGLDVFYWNPLDELNTYPINLGASLNSPADDFAFSINSSGSGYFSSNRPGGKGYDDIYSFVQKQPLQQVYHTIIQGKVTDQHTGKLLADSEISIMDSNNKKLIAVNTDSEGNYRLVAIRFSPFFIRAENENYLINEKAGDPEMQVQEINFQLERNIFLALKGDDLASALGIDAIYFDIDRAEILPDAAVQLDKILAVMEKYPQVKIEVRSHTDSRASKAYNLKLSEQRARATVEYLLQKGIAAERLSSKGFGETQPINKCADGKACSEERHQENRRSEFILMDF